MKTYITPRKQCTWSAPCADCGNIVSGDLPDMPGGVLAPKFAEAIVEKCCPSCGAPLHIDPMQLFLQFEIAVLRRDMVDVGSAFGIVASAVTAKLITRDPENAEIIAGIADLLEGAARDQENEQPSLAAWLRVIEKNMRGVMSAARGLKRKH